MPRYYIEKWSVMIGWIVFGVIVAVVVVFFGILLIRACLFRPLERTAPVITEAVVDRERIADHLAQMIRCKTVSNLNPALVDEAEFEKFRQLLKDLYPTIQQHCSFERIGPSGVLFTLRGKSNAAPVVLMSHYDVVPADEEAWEKPAFEGILEDGVLWGRGTLDTKGTLCAIMEATEALLAEGFVPQNDLYLAFSGDEEISGASAPAMVDEFERRGIRPAMVLDEGGAVVRGMFPGVAEPCALIGIAEKGMLHMEMTIEGKGGHASVPPPHTPVGLLAQAVVRIENKPFKARLTKAVAEMFDTLGRHSTLAYRLIFANLWCFKPVLDAICRKSGGEMNAMMRTTCAFTMMEGSKATNVLPPRARMGANIRLIGGDTTDSAIEYLRRVADSPAVNIQKIYGVNPSPDSRTEGQKWELLKSAISQTWPEALISPYLMFACTDSRHYCRISDNVYRFSAMELSKNERAMLHAHNERVPIETAVKTVQFYLRLIRGC